MANVHNWELEVGPEAYDTPEKARRVVERFAAMLRERGAELEGAKRLAERLDADLSEARSALEIERDSRKTTEKQSHSVVYFFEDRVKREVEERFRRARGGLEERSAGLEGENAALKSQAAELSAALDELERRHASLRRDFDARLHAAESRLISDYEAKELPLKRDYELKEEELRKRNHEVEEHEIQCRIKERELEEEHRRRLGDVQGEREALEKEIQRQKALLETARYTWDQGMEQTRSHLKAREEERETEHKARLARLERTQGALKAEAQWLKERMGERQSLWEAQMRTKDDKVTVLESELRNLRKELEEKKADYRRELAERETQFGETLQQMAQTLEKTKKAAPKKPAPEPKPGASMGTGKAAQDSAAGSMGLTDLAGPGAKLGGISPQDLVFGIAHQIRNPLAIIKTHAEHCLRTLKLEPKQREPLDAIIRGVQNLGRRLDDLVDLTRPRTVRPQKVSLQGLIEQVCILVRGRCDKQKVDLETLFPARLQDVIVDPEHIKEAMLHLLVNALDAMPDGGKLKVELMNMPTGNIVRIDVNDTGIGIAPEHMQEIYRPFFSTKPGGVGLGLTLSAQIFGTHNGAIIVDSEVGKGTSVKCYLPVQKEAAGA